MEIPFNHVDGLTECRPRLVVVFRRTGWLLNCFKSGHTPNKLWITDTELNSFWKRFVICLF